MLRGRDGDPAATLTAMEALIAEMTMALGADHPDILIGRGHAALWRARAGDHASAVAELEVLRVDLIRILGLDHPLVARVGDYLGSLLAGTPRPPVRGDPWIISDPFTH